MVACGDKSGRNEPALHLLTYLFHFKVDELTFDEGDILYIVDMTDTNWWKAKCQTKTGLIPSNYGEKCFSFIFYNHHKPFL